MRVYFAYIRVSTVKQGEKGSSLVEQRDAIEVFARRHGLTIARWFQETETAAKLGRGEFTRMIASLKKQKACGVVFHKIDRGARNLNDWNAIQDLIELGVDVRFAHESLDMNTRGGRLTADLLAVIASDYIRNLRDEVRKGIRGRLKQGLYPLGAPLGYLDQGGGKPKIPDPVRAPLVRLTFELYASGQFNVRTLADELYRRGLRTKAGAKLVASRVADLLRRTFYIGLIEMKGATYHGIHQPIVPKALFDRVQLLLSGKTHTKAVKHGYVYRRMLRCVSCGYSLIGETQKGRVYYRCHTKSCDVTGVREDIVEATLLRDLERITLNDAEVEGLRALTLKLKENWARREEDDRRALSLQRHSLESRLSRLTDVYLEGAIERDLFEAKKRQLLMERTAVADRERLGSTSAELVADRVRQFLELARSLVLSYKMAENDEKREILDSVTSNFTFDGNRVAIALRSPFREIAERAPVLSGPLTRDRPRTAFRAMFDVLIRHCSTQDQTFNGPVGHFPAPASETHRGI